MTRIVHYFNNYDKQYLIDIFIDDILFASMHPEEYESINEYHPLIYEAEHFNIFDKEY